jgi:hypothetical protein
MVMSIEREAFEQAFLNQYTDFERFENGEYMDDFLQQSWIGWQASREALEGEPVAYQYWWPESPRQVTVCKAKDLPSGGPDLIVQPLYTHPASSDNQAHWSQGNPGLADQYRQEAFAAREALGFSCDSLEVSPADIRQAIADKQAASMPEANKAWASSDPSWVLAHLKEETIFDTESIGEMLAFAKAAATSIPAKAASVPKQWVDLMRELVKDLISEIKTKQKLKPDERVAEDLGSVREAIAMIAEQEQGHE